MPSNPLATELRDFEQSETTWSPDGKEGLWAVVRKHEQTLGALRWLQTPSVGRGGREPCAS